MQIKREESSNFQDLVLEAQRVSVVMGVHVCTPLVPHRLSSVSNAFETEILCHFLHHIQAYGSCPSLLSGISIILIVRTSQYAFVSVSP